MNQDDLIRYGLIGAAVVLALVLRIRRIGRTERLRLGTMWIVPAIFALLAAALFWQFPPSGLGWLWVAMGFAAGGALGWQRGRFVEISLDPQTGQLMQRSSPTALIFLVGLMLVRWGLRWAVMEGDARWHFGAMLVSDIFLALAIGVLSFYRIELYLRARKLLRSS